MTAVRADGTYTSTTIGPAAGFGPVHDLAHYVVETSMGIRDGFLGMLATGRDIGDFDRDAGKWLSPEAVFAEAVAGELSRDAMTKIPLSTEDFNWTVRDVLACGSVDWTPPEVSSDQLTAMRSWLAELRSSWNSLPAGETLELEFK
jgi:hypothetical protein